MFDVEKLADEAGRIDIELTAVRSLGTFSLFSRSEASSALFLPRRRTSAFKQETALFLLFSDICQRSEGFKEAP
jgi:hypothetical protein